jgi:hypothetical protein
MSEVRVIKSKNEKDEWGFTKLYAEDKSPTKVIEKMKKAIPADEWEKGPDLETYWWYDPKYEDSVEVDKSWFQRHGGVFVGSFVMKGKHYTLEVDVSKRKGKWYGKGNTENID